MTTRQPTPGVHENFAEQLASFPPATLLQVRPGDRFVVRSDRPLSKEMVHHLMDNWRHFAGDEVKLLILDKGFDLSVLRDEETPPPQSHVRPFADGIREVSDLLLLEQLDRDNVAGGARPVLESQGWEQARRLSDAGLIAIENVGLGGRLHITRKGMQAVAAFKRNATTEDSDNGR